MKSNESRSSFFVRHPWVFVLFAFLLLIGAWSALITIAVKNAPQPVKVQNLAP